MEVKLFINKTAKNKIKQLFKSTVELEEDDINIINGWLEEERVKCYILCDKMII